MPDLLTELPINLLHCYVSHFLTLNELVHTQSAYVAIGKRVVLDDWMKNTVGRHRIERPAINEVDILKKYLR